MAKVQRWVAGDVPRQDYLAIGRAALLQYRSRTQAAESRRGRGRARGCGPRLRTAGRSETLAPPADRKP